MTDTDPLPDFDGCHRACRRVGAHSLVWGGCEHAVPPEPTVSMSVVYTDPADGKLSIGFDQYTAAELAAVIEPGLRASDIPVHADHLGDLARTAAEAIIHRHDKEQQ